MLRFDGPQSLFRRAPFGDWELSTSRLEIPDSFWAYLCQLDAPAAPSVKCAACAGHISAKDCTALLPCGHTFHEHCIDITNTSPECVRCQHAPAAQRHCPAMAAFAEGEVAAPPPPPSESLASKRPVLRSASRASLAAAPPPSSRQLLESVDGRKRRHELGHAELPVPASTSSEPEHASLHSECKRRRAVSMAAVTDTLTTTAASSEPSLLGQAALSIRRLRGQTSSPATLQLRHANVAGPPASSAGPSTTDRVSLKRRASAPPSVAAAPLASSPRTSLPRRAKKDKSALS